MIPEKTFGRLLELGKPQLVQAERLDAEFLEVSV